MDSSPELLQSSMPRVSICIPTYNTARYLPRAIESVLEQDFTNFELVICDDGSTDNTPEICWGYKDPRIRYIRLPGKSGQASNFNRCIREAGGEYLTILHADDYFLPGFIANRVSKLDGDPRVGFVFGAVRVVDAEGKLLSESGRWAEDRSFVKGGLVEPLLFGCILSPPSLMVRMALVKEVGLFRTDLTWGHDWEWAIRLAENAGAYYVSEPMSAYRVHDASGTAEQLNAAKNGRQERRILQETLARLSQTDRRIENLRVDVFKALCRRHMYFAEQALLAGRRAVTRNNLWYAAFADRRMIIRPTFWALLVGSFGPASLYSVYRHLRGAIVTGK